jgi:hypothetical protein
LADTPANTTPTASNTTLTDTKKSFGQQLKEVTVSGLYEGLGIKKSNPDKPVKEQMKDSLLDGLYAGLGIKKIGSTKEEQEKNPSDASKVSTPKENAKNISRINRKVDNLIIHTKKNYIEILQLKRRMSDIENKIDAIKIHEVIPVDNKGNRTPTQKAEGGGIQLPDLDLLNNVKKLAPSLTKILLNPVTLAAAGFATLAYYTGKARRENPEAAAEFDRKLKTGGARSQVIQGPQAEVEQFGQVRENVVEKLTRQEQEEWLAVIKQNPSLKKAFQNNPSSWKAAGKPKTVPESSSGSIGGRTWMATAEELLSIPRNWDSFAYNQDDLRTAAQQLTDRKVNTSSQKSLDINRLESLARKIAQERKGRANSSSNQTPSSTTGATVVTGNEQSINNRTSSSSKWYEILDNELKIPRNWSSFPYTEEDLKKAANQLASSNAAVTSQYSLNKSRLESLAIQIAKNRNTATPVTTNIQPVATPVQQIQSSLPTSTRMDDDKEKALTFDNVDLKTTGLINYESTDKIILNARVIEIKSNGGKIKFDAPEIEFVQQNYVLTESGFKPSSQGGQSGQGGAGPAATQNEPATPMVPRQSMGGASSSEETQTPMSKPTAAATPRASRGTSGSATPGDVGPSGTTPIPSSPGLGGLSARYESGRRGSEAIGWDSTGGTSYGKYQIASKTGTMRNFLSYLKTNNPEAYERLSAAGSPDSGKSGAFAQEWKKLVAEGKMGDSEHQFIKKTHYDKGMSGLSNQGLTNMIGNSKALQEVMWSTSVQHGPGGASKIFNKTYKPGMSEEDFIRAVYAERGTKFGSSTAAVQQSVMRRFQDEQKRALQLVGTPAEQPQEQSQQTATRQQAIAPSSAQGVATPVNEPSTAVPSTTPPSGMPTATTTPRTPTVAGSALSKQTVTGATGEHDLYKISYGMRGINSDRRGGSQNCGRGVGSVVGAMFGTAKGRVGIGGNAADFAGPRAKSFMSGLYEGPQGLPKGYLQDKSQWRIGDVVAMPGGRSGYGHIQTWNGKEWVSDFRQRGILTNGYNVGEGKLHRARPEAYAQMNPEYIKNMDSNGTTTAFLEGSNVVPGSAPNVGTDKAAQPNAASTIEAQRSAERVDTSVMTPEQKLNSIREGLPQNASPEAKAARERLLQAEATLRMMDPSNKMLPENQPGATPSEVTKVEPESVVPGFEGASGDLLTTELAMSAVRAASDTASSSAMGAGVESTEDLNAIPESEKQIQQQYDASRIAAESAAKSPMEKAMDAVRESTDTTSSSAMGFGEGGENLNVMPESEKQIQQQYDASRIAADTTTKTPLTDDGFKQLMSGFESDYRKKEEARLQEADRSSSFGASTTFGAMQDQSPSAERIESEIGRANLEAAQQGEIRQREKEVEQARDTAVGAMSGAAGGPIPSTGNDPEALAASPGNNGYGSKKESGDMPSICTI